MNNEEKYTNSRITQNLKPIKINEKIKLIHDIRNIEDSFTGMGEALMNGTNLFLTESSQLLINAIHLYEIGYFDCAFYSIRQAIELSTTFVYLTDLPKFERKEKLKAWISISKFPGQGIMSTDLEKKGNVYIDMKQKMKSFFDEIPKLNKKINKFVHKQGIKHFYIANYSLEANKNQESYTQEFLKFLKKGIGIVAVMRLAIDPFPVLLMDEEIILRCFDSITEPYTEDFIDEYIGRENILAYKNTESYQEYYSYFLTQPKKNYPIFEIMKFKYINTSKYKEILDEIDLLSFQDQCAVRFAFASDKVTKIYIGKGFIEYETDRFIHDGNISWSSGQFDIYLKNASSYNQPYKEAFLSVFKVSDEIFFVEHTKLLTIKEIQILKNSIPEML